ncbi:hypothetical protein M407DRAFT_181910 [Tulasnella calospora MUT 4182]|uniref:Uncharacterized protein n=1 Tax=Tulasnella calospora MUT 4182 TaxID=1051891 RepID=A0A0C3QN26_9AGAM|nr:hypothetical protein M407DRAFT_181910 [Tulasnella calospora MUT 4182]
MILSPAIFSLDTSINATTALEQPRPSGATEGTLIPHQAPSHPPSLSTSPVQAQTKPRAIPA